MLHERLHRRHPRPADQAAYLEEKLSWRSVYAYNREDFGPESLMERASDRKVVLTRPLRAALAAAAYDDALCVNVLGGRDLLLPQFIDGEISE